jgi:hypothetical protein
VVRDFIIFLASEFICFGILGAIHKGLLEGNLKNMDFYSRNFEATDYFLLLVPFFIGVILIFLVKFWNKGSEIKYVIIIIISSLIVMIFMLKSFANQMGSDFENFAWSYIIYIVFLGSLWFFVYKLHDHLINKLRH